MVGTIRWNLIVGSIGFLLTFSISISNNIVTTTLLRSFYSALILFIFVFAFRWFLGTVVEMKIIENKLDITRADSGEELHKGNTFDYTTPVDGVPQYNNTANNDASTFGDPTFLPLNPPKLLSKNNLEPQELVKAMRQMSED